MIYLYSFLVCGFICALGQVIAEYTKFTPGEINTIFVTLGAFLSFLGIYDKLLSFAGAGASIPITNFGHLIYKGAYEGYLDGKITGLLNNVFSKCSGGLAFTIALGFIIGLFFKPRH